MEYGGATSSKRVKRPSGCRGEQVESGVFVYETFADGPAAVLCTGEKITKKQQLRCQGIEFIGHRKPAKYIDDNRGYQKTRRK